MPVLTTYPGVYIEEIPAVCAPSPVSPLPSRRLSVALARPRQRAGHDQQLRRFRTQFGGLDMDYPMGYAVRDFYLNGGSQAIIVRLEKNAGKGEKQRRQTGGRQPW